MVAQRGNLSFLSDLLNKVKDPGTERCLSLPKTQTPFRPRGWKGVFARLPGWFAALQLGSVEKSHNVASEKAEKVSGKDKRH
jgi:hypothetical protein